MKRPWFPSKFLTWGGVCVEGWRVCCTLYETRPTPCPLGTGPTSGPKTRGDTGCVRHTGACSEKGRHPESKEYSSYCSCRTFDGFVKIMSYPLLMSETPVENVRHTRSHSVDGRDSKHQKNKRFVSIVMNKVSYSRCFVSHRLY